jgi:hypothetical protein
LSVTSNRLASSEWLCQPLQSATANRAATTWTDFLRTQADALLAADSIETVALSGAKMYILAVIEHATSELDIRVTITGDTAAELAATVEAAVEQSSQSEQRATDEPDRTPHDPRADALRARGGSRTRTPFWGSRF